MTQRIAMGRDPGLQGAGGGDGPETLAVSEPDPPITRAGGSRPSVSTRHERQTQCVHLCVRACVYACVLEHRMGAVRRALMCAGPLGSEGARETLDC